MAGSAATTGRHPPLWRRVHRAASPSVASHLLRGTTSTTAAASRPGTARYLLHLQHLRTPTTTPPHLLPCFPRTRLFVTLTPVFDFPTA